MKNKIIITGLFFVLMAVLPLSFIVKPVKPADAESKTVKKTNEYSYIAAVANLCGDGYCDEAIRALAILEKTNAAAGQAAGEGADNSGTEIYKRAENIYNSNKEILLYEGKAVAVPVEVCSNGFTEADGDKAYIEAVASPWDAFSKRYSSKLSCRGVSADGVNYLCQSGMSAEEALRWYLPKLTVTHQSETNS